MKEPIAIHQSHFPVIALIYGTDATDDHVIAAVGSAYTESQDAAGNKRPRKYKLYPAANGRSYFRAYGYRFYLDEALRLV